MASRSKPIASCLAAGAACLLIAAGCGASGSDTVTQRTSASGAPEPAAPEQPLSAAELHGRDLFVDHCGTCHTLTAAGTTGQLGPHLDDIALTRAEIQRAIRIGGGPDSRGGGGRSGNMPPNLVTGKDAQDVAAFVAANASGSSTP
jgi:mono/diheme cytochrome c family protein